MDDPTIMCITFTEKMFTKSREKKKKNEPQPTSGFKSLFKISFFSPRC